MLDMMSNKVFASNQNVFDSTNDIVGAREVKSHSFGQRLRIERERLGLTQDAFALIGGVKRSSQHLYESDARVPDYHYLERMKNSGVDLVYLILGERSVPVRKNALMFSPVTLANLYELVDEFCIDDEGLLLPLDSRKRFFRMLCAAVGNLQGEDANIEALRAEFTSR